MALTHFNEDGRARMVDVGDKNVTKRIARASGCIMMKSETLKRIRAGMIKKGDVLQVAQIAAIMGAKNTGAMIPMCHNIPLTGVDVFFEIKEEHIEIIAEVRTEGKTGIEMEALMAVTTAALTIYDMCKAVDKEMTITNVCLIHKSGGASGSYNRS